MPGAPASADLDRVIAFALELDKLKAVLRRTRPSNLDRPENSAEHSWHVALLASSLAPYADPPVDLARVTELLLVHDVPEIDAGDTIVYGRAPGAVAEERRAAARVFGLLPDPQGSLFLARWEEFEARETAEARFAYAVDRVMPVLHNLRDGGRTWRENGIALDQVLAVNQAIGAACPALWEHVKRRVEDHFAHAQAKEIP
ncbi:MAG TPA: HD domain-containing protein [Candidatus Omnitrophota bacterium]|nr:HD domain-containing protein [Candidatus Omnitrophota bacterium]